MISVYNSIDDCCGCTACQHICPINAIQMVPDSEGFLYPFINQGLCVDCELCRKVCAFQNGYDTSQNLELPDVYAAQHNNESIRLGSTSGGVFTAISDYVLCEAGVVYGVAFDINMNVVHQKAITKDDRNKFKGSKYVQSNLCNTFKEIKELLEKQKLVLFTGTPCQTAGLKSYLKLNNTDTVNMILCDIVCHGTPSPLIWKEHINSLEKREKSKVIDYYCRPKVRGWHGHNEMVVYQNGKKDFESISSQMFKTLFYSHNMLRPSCHSCKYTNLTRPSDITIADFWGIEKSMPDFDDNKGTSLIIINSDKGKKLFDMIEGSLIHRESNIVDCLQPQLQYPSKPSSNREQFWNDYYSKGYDYITKKYAGNNIKCIMKNKVKIVLFRLEILEVIKKILR